MDRSPKSSVLHLISVLVCGVVLSAAVIVAQALPAAPMDEETLAAAPDSIDALRSSGEYETALELAREVLAARRAAAETPAYEIDDAERLAATLEMICAMPPSARAMLAYADSLYAVAGQLLDSGVFGEAADCAERAVGLRRELLGRAPVEVADGLSLLGVILLYDNEPEAARPAFDEALSIRRSVVGEGHPDVAGEMANLAQVQQSLGDNDSAESLSRQAIEIDRAIGAEDRPEYALLVNNLAAILLARGDYAAADPLFREALARLRPLVGDESLDVVILTANLASLQQKMGNEAAAEALYEEALAMQEKIEPGNHPNTALYLADLATVQESSGDYPAAERSCRQALAMQEDVLDENDPDLAVTSIILGRTLLAEGAAGAAAEAYRRALEISARAGRSMHPDAASAYHGLGLALYVAGDLEGATDALLQAISVREAVLGVEHPYTVESRIRLALVRRAQGRLAAADSLLTAASRSYESARRRAGSGLERATFMGSPYPFLAIVRIERGLTATAWPEAENELARVLSDLLRASGGERLAPREKSEGDSLRATLRDLERRLVVYRGSSESDTSGDAARRAEATRDTLLMTEARWAGFMKGLEIHQSAEDGRPMSLEHVQAALTPETAIVGWCETEMGPYQNLCWAYVIRRDALVRWTQVGADDQGAAGSASPWRVYSNALSSPASSQAGLTRQSRILFDARFGPLEVFLEGIRNLVIIPSGSTFGVPLETLARGDGTLLGDRFAISYVPSATLFAWLSERRRPREVESERNLFIGDPPFSSEQRETMESDSPESGPPGAPAIRGFSWVTGLPRLMAARQEVTELAALVPGSRTLLGADASEPELVRLAQSDSLAGFSWIHFATHALVDDRHPENSALVLSQVDLPDPLDSAVKGSRIYDGLLTAREIVAEWRLNADLVSLSACQTGRGKDLRGEGTVGLAHAFLQSGARSLLVSLWKVDDRATALLMRRFGENTTGIRIEEVNGAAKRIRIPRMGKAEALQEAKTWLRGLAEDHHRPYSHPYYWSAFVLVGDNR